MIDYDTMSDEQLFERIKAGDKPKDARVLRRMIALGERKIAEINDRQKKLNTEIEQNRQRIAQLIAERDDLLRGFINKSALFFRVLSLYVSPSQAEELCKPENSTSKSS